MSYKKRLDKLNLGENFISTIPSNAFNNTLNVNDLKLDYNYSEILQESIAQDFPRWAEKLTH